MTFNISSRLTVILKFAIPIFWLVNMGGLTVLLLFTNPENSLVGAASFKISWTLFFLLFAFLFYKTIFKLMRMDGDADYFYISDYFKTVRIPWNKLRKVSQTDALIGELLQLEVSVPTPFGHKFFILANKKRWQATLETLGEKLEHLRE